MMQVIGNSSYIGIPIFDDDTKQFYYIQLWIFLLLIIPSMTSSLFGLYYLLRDRTLRQSLNHHLIILLLIITLFYECTVVVLLIHYFRCFESFIPTPMFRLLWAYVDWTVYIIQMMIYAWATIEKHILVFHDHLLATRNKRICLHYLPPLVIAIYCIIYYALIFFVVPCENYFGDLTIPSLIPCAFLINTFLLYETMVQHTLPILIIVISSLVLLFRVLWQRYHIDRQIQWRRYRRMTIQILSISSVYLIFLFPSMVVNILDLCGVLSNVKNEFLSRWMFCSFYTLLIFPMMALGTSSELKAKIKANLRCHRPHRVIVPIKTNALRIRYNAEVNQ